MRTLLTTTLLALLPCFVFSQDKVSNYISNYQHIAIAEMNRSGIPASITLAQGMFESAYGQSPSAIGYNNHFGIKCKKEWTGPYFYKHDDDRDKNGKLIPSCFRAYPNVDASFQDHTNFLVERSRYAELFTYPQTDYYNWAMGLQRCGYATNKKYGERLVEIIERYALYQYDVPQEVSPVLVSSEPEPIFISPSSTSMELAPVATDAFAEVLSEEKEEEENAPTVVATPIVTVESSTSVDLEPADTDAFAEVLNQKNEELAPVTIETSINDPFPVEVVTEVVETPTKTLVILDSFEEFTSVSPIKVQVEEQKKIKPTSQKTITTTPKNRVNQAIILPSNYQRKSDIDNSEASKLDKR